MSGKKLLILERQKSNLDITTGEDGSVVLEGVLPSLMLRTRTTGFTRKKK